MIMADPVGEDGWLAFVDEASRTARDLEQRIGVVELYKRAIAAEPWSKKLWLAYCEWFWSLYTDCQNGDAGWPEEEQALGQEVFSLDIALSIWQEGAKAIQYRLNDSHELWNRWISIELEQLTANPNPHTVERIRKLFIERMQIPHSTWDETSQMYSTFLTKYDNNAWESAMVEMTGLAKNAKDIYSLREPHEIKLQEAVESGDPENIKHVMKEYLAWEVGQSEKRTKKGVLSTPMIYCVALHERALCSTPLALDPSAWEDYIVFLSSARIDQPQSGISSVLPVIQRATNHCPWAGSIWARYILCAEAEGQPFATMQHIKHAATQTRELDRDGMDGVVEFYVAWSGYLRRRTMVEGATDEDDDVAEMGLTTALEDVQEWGKRREGKSWTGDPLFRIERIFIQYRTQKGAISEAREVWKKLARTRGDGYEFWLQYYVWEMTVWDGHAPPTLATGVLHQGVNRRCLDWPEKMMEVYLRHCNNYEEVGILLKTMNNLYKLGKRVVKRRELEAEQAAVMYAQQQPEVAAAAAAAADSPSTKRKREDEETDGNVKKKAKAIDHEALREQQLKRDRENTTVLVTNLPGDVTQTKVKQYFKEFGHINDIKMQSEDNKASSTALIEFQTPEDAQSALLRDGKYFTDRQIKVVPGTNLTLYVTNFPPNADDSYFRKLFKDCGEIFSIRWPSLKYNAHRRFCYVSFRTQEGAAAATRLDGKELGGVYKLVAKYSDPANKKNREGAMAEGREIHITGIDTTLSEGDLRDVFAKYGTLEKVRILKTKSGESKGAGFIAFEKAEEAKAAVEMDKTKLKSRVLTVELSTGKNFKPTATSIGKASLASPAPDGNGVSAMSPSPAPDGYVNTHALQAPPRTEARDKIITLMNIPDTINDARIRIIAEPYGEISKLVLRPDHQGAIIEYADAASAGRAALALEGYEITPGRKLRTGGMKDLFAEKDEIKNDRIQTGQAKKVAATFIQPTTPVKRPGPGGRGGLGVKRGLGYSAAAKSTGAAMDPSTTDGGVNGHQEGHKKPKSNADFKAMFVSGGK